MMMKIETLARSLLILLVGAAVAVPIGWRTIPEINRSGDAVEIHARLPENGGWLPGELAVDAGEELHLRLTSDDVMHSFAVGKSDLPAVDVIPGKVSEITLRFDQPGTYTYYCTRWCGPNHWRMRGAIEVRGPQETVTPPAQPLFLRLGLDLDATPAPLPVSPSGRPSADRGAALGVDVPPEYTSKEYFRTHSPAELFEALKSEPLGARLRDGQIWDLVAFTWRSSMDLAALAAGEALYAQNCAACHGETGGGDGVMADALPAQTPAITETPADHPEETPGSHAPGGSGYGHTVVAPSDFTDMSIMLSLNSARLQGKILRGGMGTGMPYWGPILTEEETWALVAYLWTFVFE